MSRYGISLNVAHGSTDEEVANAYFDQVTAISQGTINSNFKSLFKQAVAAGSDVNKLIYSNEDTGDTGERIQATLDPPSIIINGLTSNATQVFYQLRYVYFYLQNNFRKARTDKLKDQYGNGDLRQWA